MKCQWRIDCRFDPLQYRNETDDPVGLVVCLAVWFGGQISLAQTTATTAETKVPEPELVRRLQGLIGKAQFADAIPLAQELLTNSAKSYGAFHTNTAAALDRLAEGYANLLNFTNSPALGARALEIKESLLGLERLDTATLLNSLGERYNRMTDYAKAEPLYQRSLEILERVLGPEHPDTRAVLANLCVLNLNLRKLDAALFLARKYKAVSERSLGHILSFASERQRLSYKDKVNFPVASLLGTLGSAADLAESTLRTKGVVLDSLLEDELTAHASGDPAVKEAVDKLHTAGRRLTQLEMEAPRDTSPEGLNQRRAEVRRLERQAEAAQKSLARNVTSVGQVRRALRITVPEVQAPLTKDAVLLEFVQYHHLGNMKSELRYGVVMVANATIALDDAKVGEPVWVPLGSAETIEQNLHDYGAVMRGGRKGEFRVLRTLHAQLVAPIQSRLPKGITTLIISAEAELNFLSFATLGDAQGRFMAEHYRIRYVASGRDLVFGPTAQVRSRRFAAFANPAFGEKPAVAGASIVSAARQTTPSADRGDYAGMTFGALPNTSMEAQFLRERSSAWHLKGAVHVGAGASEREVKAVKSPYIPHLATHGFFLPDNSPTNAPTFAPPSLGEQPAPVPAVFHNPMQRSGLAFAGAQLTMDAWKRGATPDTENDGILMAQEVGTMDLKDTWLVVLSACDTGIGEARNGEGVLGLRRGFVQAGTQNLLMTLWPISDRWTVDIMKAFYEKAMATGDAPQAMAEVQAKWLGRLRKEKGILLAARLAGPFVLSTRGRQPGR